jgi:hypothetical protein
VNVSGIATCGGASKISRRSIDATFLSSNLSTESPLEKLHARNAEGAAVAHA